ncbi:hypothetical protein [Pseudomonas sp. R5(2019)]|uniref:hypothetical protein n=1 Tax=Pseudomonas sp. R5(2019) TaxID=2697566 RepID=UPI00141352C9|nr:hypothetical protein [Pseudomonas sp. R5(2019)]NBA96392.1 hypothetical protein [Pseudomonas sp. R5(2019)]
MQDSRFAQGFRTLGVGLAALSLAALMSGCVSSEGKPANDVPIEKETSAVPMATPPQVYAKEIGSARFERSGIKEVQGYTVESGNLLTKDGDTGSLVVVRSATGAVLAIVDKPGERGLLLVDKDNNRKFIPESPSDYMQLDTVEQAEVIQPAKGDEKKAGEHKYVDMLFAFTAWSAEKIGGDPIAYALAQTETANLGLRNSLVSGVSLRLVAVSIFNEGGSVTAEGLRWWQNTLEPYRTLYNADVSAAISGGNATANGWAYNPGWTSANVYWAPLVFRHEIGHNAGGSHCNNDPNSTNYRFGHSNGKSNTFLCGNNVPYYSTTRVRDPDGNPLGNAKTADMARVWEENTARMTGYRPELPGERLILAGLGEQETARLRMDTSVPNPRAGLVALDPSVGPTQLQALPGGGYTTLTVKLKNDAGVEFPVKLRAQRSIGGCPVSGMNNNAACQGGGALFFTLQYFNIDNQHLANGFYNGVLKLKAMDAAAPGWQVPVTISVSVAVSGSSGSRESVTIRHEDACVVLDFGAPGMLGLGRDECNRKPESSLTDPAQWHITADQKITYNLGLYFLHGNRRPELNELNTGKPPLHVRYLGGDSVRIENGGQCMTYAPNPRALYLDVCSAANHGQVWRLQDR